MSWVCLCTYTHTSLLTDIQMHKHQIVWGLWLSACQLNSHLFFLSCTDVYIRTSPHTCSHRANYHMRVSVGSETIAISLSSSCMISGFSREQWTKCFGKGRWKSSFDSCFWCQLKWEGTWFRFLLSNAAYCLLSGLARVQENPDIVLNYVTNQGLWHTALSCACLLFGMTSSKLYQKNCSASEFSKGLYLTGTMWLLCIYYFFHMVIRAD